MPLAKLFHGVMGVRVKLGFERGLVHMGGLQKSH